MTKEELFAMLHRTTVKHQCSICGKEIEIPHINVRKEPDILNPYCCSFATFAVQYMVHEGWHIRNLGISDNHPYFCPDCWTEGTPEYKKRDYCDDWYKQSNEWLQSKIGNDF